MWCGASFPIFPPAKKIRQLQSSSTHLSTHSSSSKVSRLKAHAPRQRKGDVSCFNLHYDNESFRVSLGDELQKRRGSSFGLTICRSSTSITEALLRRGRLFRFVFCLFRFFSPRSKHGEAINAEPASMPFSALLGVRKPDQGLIQVERSNLSQRLDNP